MIGISVYESKETLYSKGFYNKASEILYQQAFQQSAKLRFWIYQTSYLYKTLATCGFEGIGSCIKKSVNNFVGIKNRLYLPLIKKSNILL